jgi:hypothetical protein
MEKNKKQKKCNGCIEIICNCINGATIIKLNNQKVKKKRISSCKSCFVFKVNSKEIRGWLPVLASKWSENSRCHNPGERNI